MDDRRKKANGARDAAFPGLEYEDITAQFLSATAELGVGQLLTADGFKFADGMMSLEIMDPKMDSGMSIPPTAGDHAGCAEVVDAGALKGLALTPPELLGIMDAMLCQEEQWHRADLLCMTVFTGVFLHRISDVQDSVLKSYMLAVLKTCGTARDAIMKAAIHTEEDFMPDNSGFSLCEGVPDSVILDGLKNAEDEVLKRMKVKATNGTSKEATSDPAIWEAIVVRIRFRRAFLQLMSNLAKGSAKGFANAAKYLANAKLQLELLSKTTNLAADCSRFFDPNMNRHLFTHGPPRPPCPLSIDSAISFRKRTLEDLEQVLKANECTSLLSAIQHARFFGLRLPTPNILTRSLFIHNLASETRLLGRIDLSKLAQDGAQAFAASPYPTASKEAKSILAKFAKRCELPIMYLLRSMLYNRPRQRRMLQKSVLEWEQLQSEAEEMDMALQELVPGVSKEAFYLSSWIYHIKLVLIDLVISAGFELDLYNLHEYPLVFAMWNHVADAHVGHIERTEELRIGDVAKSTSKRSLLGAAHAQQMHLLSCEKLHRVAQWHVTRAMFRVSSALSALGAIKEPSESPDQSKTRFLQRFRALQYLGSPTPLSFEDYATAFETARADPEKALAEAADLFGKARSQMTGLMQRAGPETYTELCKAEFSEDCQGIVKSIVANSVAVKLLQTALQSTDGQKKITVSSEAKHHRWFPTLSVATKS